MRIQEFTQLLEPPEKYDPDWMRNVIAQIAETFNEHARVLNGGIGFGDATDFDNLIGKWMTYTTNSTPNTEDTLTHDLGVIPIGIIVMQPPQSGVINKGSTAWTTSQIFLKCSAGSQTAVLFLVVPSHGV